MSAEDVPSSLALGIRPEFAGEWAELAAILEYCRGNPRDAAERFAAAAVLGQYPHAAYTAATHWRNAGKALCGTHAKAANLTGERDAVTCRKCLKKLGG